MRPTAWAGCGGCRLGCAMTETEAKNAALVKIITGLIKHMEHYMQRHADVCSVNDGRWLQAAKTALAECHEVQQ